MTSNNNEQTEPEKKPVQESQEQSSREKPGEESPVSAAQKDTNTDTAVKEQNKPLPKQKSRKAVPSPEVKSGKTGGKLGALAIVLSLCIGGGGAYLIKQQAQQYQTQVTELQLQLNKVSDQLSRSEAALQSAIQSTVDSTRITMGQQDKSIHSLQMALSEIKGRRPNDWLLAEADYLVKLAGRKLFLEKDVVSATRLMESADQRISALNDPSLVPLRKEMAKDITVLSAVPLIDKDGLALRLMSLQQQVDKLPLANAILPEAPQEVHQEVSEDIQDWKENLLTSLKDFSEQFITFRTRDGNVIPLLSPKQDFYLRENIKGKLETAISAVYDENSDIYQMALTQANQWSQQFFKMDDKAVVTFNQTLTALSSQNIRVEYPVKLVSQKVLTDVIRERLRRDITSIIKEEKQ
ncbi:heme biosynthesis operon protein HemX [Vibrio sp. HA2012]|uniref:uroporphyrinogen-III C-methyltransferase n=1 Tax=Vibrio sp. HA2012 TaxID=1971595 RepID=UPI000C2B7396|nr:uroporphyrinogen-III C-methyltransferase [Vibrio sp. HA2012]PJC84984.1 heme biosynthesis operon protein HemX [Vibrio sp. HA2012]